MARMKMGKNAQAFDFPLFLFFHFVNAHHDSVLFFARVFRLVHVVVTIALVILRDRSTLELTEFRQRLCPYYHFFETGWFVLRTIKHIRCVFVKNDALSHHVACVYHCDQALQNQHQTIILRSHTMTPGQTFKFRVQSQ